MSRLIDLTIWGQRRRRGNRWITRVLTPAFYLAFVLVGTLGLINGVPVLRDTYGTGFSSAFAIWQIGMAVIALAAYLFPNHRTAWIELGFAAGLMAQLTTYAFLLGAYAIFGDADRGYVAGVALFGVLAVLVRLNFLTDEIRYRRATREVATRLVSE